MDSSTITLGATAMALLAYIIGWRRERLGAVVQQIKLQARLVLFSFPGGILIAAFVSQLLPAELIAGLVGKESGLWGIVLAGLLGGLIPGGPMLSFPIALTIWHAGAGPAQMIAFLTGWSLLTVHRILTYEAPLMGVRFAAIRFAASLPLPVVAGVAALLLIQFGWTVA